MRIQQTFSDDFDTLYNNYSTSDNGKKLLRIEGISREYLDVGAMSKAYFTQHIPDATCDSNANANEGISPNNYSSEIVKGLSKLDGYYLLYHYAKRRYGQKRADELIRAIWKGDVYFHDATKPQIPYSYYGPTSIVIRINDGPPVMTTLHALFTKMSKSAVRAGDADVIDLVHPVIYPISVVTRRSPGPNPRINYQSLWTYARGLYRKSLKIEVWNGSEWVRLTRVIRHERPEGQRLIALMTDSGNVTIVTDDHPVVLEDGTTIPASKVRVGHRLKECDCRVPHCPSIHVDDDLAYIVGFLTARGSTYLDHVITKYGRNIPTDIIEKFKESVERLGIKHNDIQEANTSVRVIELFGRDLCGIMLHEFNMGNRTLSKTMPWDILQWDRRSMIAYVAGLLDANWNVDGNVIVYRTKSFGIAVQLKEIMKILGCDFCRVVLDLTNTRNAIKRAEALNVAFRVEILPSKDVLRQLSALSVCAQYYRPDYEMDMHAGIENKVTKVVDIIVRDNQHTDQLDKYVYDITVDGQLFYSQGLIQHNCFSYSTSHIMVEGRPYGQLKSVPPKRADSFMAQAIETTMDLSQEYAGAIAPADLIINYAWYAKREGLDDKAIINDFQKFVHVMNNKFRVSAESPFTNVSLFDRYALETITKGMVYPDGSKPDIDYIMRLQKLFGEWFARGDPVSGMPYRFPVVTANLTRGKKGEILDQDFLDWLCVNNISTACFNIYVNEGTKIASCCRMVNDVDRMRNFRGDSFGNGGTNLGSHRVVTINLPRIAILADGDQKKFMELLQDRLDVCRDLLQVHREEILKRRVDAGFLKFYNPLKWFSLDHMFSTIGIIGVYEMVELMGMDIRTEKGVKFTLSVLKAIEEYAKIVSRETGHAFNVEEVPGESVAVKLCEKDKVLFGDKVPYELYSNQYIPLIVDAPIAERIKVSGRFMDILSGGGILHLNVQERITDPAVMRRIIEYAVKCGVSHMAINYGFGTCENGHVTICGNAKKCPVCNGDIVSWMTRVIGYFSVVSNWNKIRREYEFPRRQFNGVEI